MQPSSHNCPREMREALWRSLKIFADFARFDKVGADIGKIPDSCDVMLSLLGRTTVGPGACRRFINIFASDSFQ